MKKYIVALLTVGLTGCTSFFDIPPTDQLTQNEFWKTRQHAEAALIGAYNQLVNGNIYGNVSMIGMEAATPNAYTYNNTGGGGFIAQGIHDAANNGIINNKWGACYTGIGRANTLLDNIGQVTVDEATKKRYIAEAKFLRALYYHNLWSFYGGVPLILETPNLEKQGTLPRNSADEVYAQIIKDCNEAIPDLPQTAASRGNASKGAALALKARTMLYKGDYPGAAEAAKQIIDSKVFTLFSDYRELFQLDKEGNSEVIFDVQFKLPEFTHSLDITFTDFNSIAPLPDLLNDYYMVDGLPAAKSPLFNNAKPYDNRDPRLYQTNILPGTQFRARLVTPTTFGFTGIGQKKYTVYKDNEAGVTVAENQSQLNYMVFRYADVLLMYAEAQNEVAGPSPEIYSALNLIRQRAGMPAFPKDLTKDQLREEIRHERRIELAGEGLYYHDIRRWRTAEIVMNTEIVNYTGGKLGVRRFNKDRDYLWPIPTIVLERNPNLVQNAGYGK
ncbi:RagB/SusD family nutrient uptake outer membrane protein [Rudanella lutea]|uniref:RagB/SusD family nutrient uptake outer membrane protein n=1 Tax=Rudanella lutea TaxID=451374 RepID=UPI000378BE0F|nr:RagB/SusD family nutrient uptake outer membrane protein [Rudanella lutea]